MSDPQIHVRISKASQVVWEGDATGVSSVNSSGPFDILPLHANFLSLVQGHPIVVHIQGQKDKMYKFRQAVVHVQNNEARIYVDIA